MFFSYGPIGQWIDSRCTPCSRQCRGARSHRDCHSTPCDSQTAIFLPRSSRHLEATVSLAAQQMRNERFIKETTKLSVSVMEGNTLLITSRALPANALALTTHCRFLFKPSICKPNHRRRRKGFFVQKETVRGERAFRGFLIFRRRSFKTALEH